MSKRKRRGPAGRGAAGAAKPPEPPAPAGEHPGAGTIGVEPTRAPETATPAAGDPPEPPTAEVVAPPEGAAMFASETIAAPAEPPAAVTEAEPAPIAAPPEPPAAVTETEPAPIAAPPEPAPPLTVPEPPAGPAPPAVEVVGPRVLRVGIDGRSLQGGFREDSGRGIGVYARELVRALAVRKDVALTLWFEPALPAVPKGFLPPGVGVRHYARVWLPMRDRLSSHLSVPLAAAARSHDVFHWLAHVHAPAFPPRRSVVTVHDLILEQLAPLYPRHRSAGYRLARRLEGLAIRNAAMLVSDSNATRADLLARHRVDPARVFVAPLGVHPRFAPAPGPQVAAVRKFHRLDAPFLLYLGGIDARKDIGVLLEAFAGVRAGRAEPLLLVLAGHVLRAPEYPALVRRAAELGITDALRVLEFVPLPHLAMLLTAARVFAFPSRCEGFGLPPLEAMACGTPVVSTTGGSLGEVLGEAALTVPPGDAPAFARALASALDDEPLRAELRARGLTRAASFTWARTAESTLAAYRAATRAQAGA